MDQPEAAAPLPARPRRRWLVPSLLAAAAFAAFLPALAAGFIAWDDEPLLLRNPAYRGVGWSHLRWMFTTTLMGHWMPLAWVSYGLDYLLWGMTPFGYHLTSLLLHAASAALAYLVALRLLCAAAPPAGPADRPWLAWGAAWAALLFAVHPLRVESVAWVTERRDVLSGLFFLASLWAYLRRQDAAPAERGRWYWLALGCFALALLGKSMAVTLPAVLLLLDLYPLRRLPPRPRDWLGAEARPVWLEKLPFFALALGPTAMAFRGVMAGGGMTSVERLGWAERGAITVYGWGFYLLKTVLPVGLSPLYELPLTVDPQAPGVLLGGVFALALTIVALAARRRWPALLAGWAAYLVLLLPVSGLFHNGYQITADRYTYLPSLPWALLAGAGLAAAGRRGGVRAALALPALALAVTAGLGVATWRQTALWHDSERLWHHAVALDPASGIAHANLGAALAERGKDEEAAAHFQRALALRADYAEAHLYLGVLLARRGRTAEAAAQFERTLRLRPHSADAHNNLGITLAQSGRLAEAVGHFERAVALDPASADARNNLGRALAEQGRLAEAERHFAEAVRLRPGFREAQGNLEYARRLQGR